MKQEVIIKLNLVELPFYVGEAFIHNEKLYRYKYKGYDFNLMTCNSQGKPLPEGQINVWYKGIKNGIKYFITSSFTDKLITECPSVAINIFFDEMIEKIINKQTELAAPDR